MAQITLKLVSVGFPIYSAHSRSLRSMVLNATTGGRIGTDGSNRTCVQALEAVNITINHGDRVGLIGHNGAGKTTLLRVLAGIYEPNTGAIEVDGKVTSLFDIGLGIDPESTGYENIVLRGLYMGMSKAEIYKKMSEIVDFTELGEFLALPVRTYSTGMQARLAFAVATCISPEILLLDEGIGSGDAAFFEKASRRVATFVEAAGILVLASHSEEMIRNLCNQVILMEHGRVVTQATVDEGFALYHKRRHQ
jgi:ABC-2 type transport system ATP-binding protein